MEETEIALLKKYFPAVTDKQTNIFVEIYELYKFWNKKINVISQKDIDNLFIRHILHSLSTAHFFSFKAGETVVDVGTGGGFPGIPLAVIFPEVNFTLIDSTGKKIKVVNEIKEAAGLKNVKAIQKRSNEYRERFNFVTGRAVTAFPAFYDSVKHLLKKQNNRNGILYLKGGSFNDELKRFKKVKVFHLKNFIKEDFFETKKLIYLKK